MMASELESDVTPQTTTESSASLPRAVPLPEGQPMANVPEDQTVLYRVSTDVEYASRYVKEVDNKLMQFTGQVPEVEQYYALKVSDYLTLSVNSSPYCEACSYYSFVR